MGCRLLLFFFIMAGRARFAHNTHAEDKMWARGTAWRVLRARSTHCVVPHVKCVSKARRAISRARHSVWIGRIIRRATITHARIFCVSLLLFFYITRSKHTTGGTRCAAYIPASDVNIFICAASIRQHTPCAAGERWENCECSLVARLLCW